MLLQQIFIAFIIKKAISAIKNRNVSWKCLAVWWYDYWSVSWPQDRCQQSNGSLFHLSQEKDDASYCALQACLDGCPVGLQRLTWWDEVGDHGGAWKLLASNPGQLACKGPWWLWQSRGLVYWGGAHQLLMLQLLSCCAVTRTVMSHADRPLRFKPGHICCASHDLQNPEQKEMQNIRFSSRLSADTSV